MRINEFEKAEITSDYVFPVPDGVIRVKDCGKDIRRAVCFKCPCGCGETLWLMERKEGDPPGGEPTWTIDAKDGKVTLSPSVVLLMGCHSHFFIRNNKVIWC